MMLVSLARAKNLLKYETPARDDALEFAIATASQLVIRYLKDAALPFLDSGGDPIENEVPENVQYATAMLAGYLDRNPDADPDQAFEMGYLPKPVMALLYSMRRPALE